MSEDNYKCHRPVDPGHRWKSLRTGKDHTSHLVQPLSSQVVKLVHMEVIMTQTHPTPAETQATRLPVLDKRKTTKPHKPRVNKEKVKFTKSTPLPWEQRLSCLEG